MFKVVSTTGQARILARAAHLRKGFKAYVGL
jgi:hypothetical protein